MLYHDQKRSGRIFLQTSVIVTVSTQCYTKGPWKEGELLANLTCCFHCPAMQHPLLGGDQSLQWCFFTPVNRQEKNPKITIYNTCHQDWLHSVIPLSTIPKTNSVTAAKNSTELYNKVWCGVDRASSLICGNKMPTRCNRGCKPDA